MKERPDGENSEMDREWWADDRCDPWKEGWLPGPFHTTLQRDVGCIEFP